MTDGETFSNAASSVLDAEAERQATDDESRRRPVFADDLLPGVGEDEVSLADGLRQGGHTTLIVLMLLVAFDELEAASLSVLAPDIRDTFGVSDGTIVFMAAAVGGFIVLGGLPLGWLADRMRRSLIIGGAGFVFAAMVTLSGLATNAFMLFWTRAGWVWPRPAPSPCTVRCWPTPTPSACGVGSARATSCRAGSWARSAPSLSAESPPWPAAHEGWRWSFLVLGIPTAVIAFFALRLPEPVRGQHEKLDVLGEAIEDASPTPISMEAGWARLMEIKTLRTTIMAFAALGFGIFTEPILANLYMEDEFGLSSFERGLVTTVSGLGALCVLPFVGRSFDRRYRRDPSRALATVGYLVIPVSVLLPVRYAMPSAWSFAVAGIPPAILLSASFVMIGPVIQAVVPYRLRGLGSALAGVYIFFVGAVGGGFVSFLLLSANGPRPTAIMIMAPASLIGGWLLVRSSSFIRNDLSMIVADLREELDEHQRQQTDPAHVPALQVHDIDFSYGPVQILFGVDFEVAKGECLALLGTNGAGKSTILRVIAGLGTPSRGSVRLHGRNITYASPEQRIAAGIQLLPGGKGVFPALTVGDNLEVGVVRAPSRPEPPPTQHRPGHDPLPGAGRGLRPAGGNSVRRPATDVGAGPGTAPRTRGPHHRRAVTRPRPRRGPGPPAGGGAAQGGRPHHDHRRAVPQRGPGGGRPGHLPREGSGALRRLGAGPPRA